MEKKKKVIILAAMLVMIVVSTTVVVAEPYTNCTIEDAQKYLYGDEDCDGYNNGIELGPTRGGFERPLDDGFLDLPAGYDPCDPCKPDPSCDACREQEIEKQQDLARSENDQILEEFEDLEDLLPAPHEPLPIPDSVIPASDRDGDGVPDFRDDCWGTAKGTDVDIRGCPIGIKSQIKEFLLQNRGISLLVFTVIIFVLYNIFRKPNRPN